MPIYHTAELATPRNVSVAAGRGADRIRNPYGLTDKDLAVCLSLFDRRAPEAVLEFGVNRGHTAALLLEYCPWIRLYVGVDLIPERFPNRGIVPSRAGDLAAGDPRFHAVVTDETIAYLLRALQAAGWNWFDAILLDADHEYAGTRRDTEGTDLFLRQGGLRIWHDYNVESRQDPGRGPFTLKRYLDELAAAGRAIHFPDEADRDPWRCCSIAWEIKGPPP